MNMQPDARPAIDVDGVRKTYLLYRSPAERFLDLALGGNRRAQHFNALDGVSFQVQRGETVGIVGRNGAGKSTLLSIIANVMTPTAGRVQVNGRVAALLELGAGFHPEYSGRDNVYLAASLLGLSTHEIDQKFDAIREFADIGDHFDQPVRTYSSGMYVRLAFAVYTVVEPDILIVDEALAVGDAAFQIKCYRRLRQLRERGAAILLVTHDVQTVRLFCDRAIWIDSGRLRLDGRPDQVCAEYLRDLFDGTPAAEEAAPLDAQSSIPEHGLSSAVDLSSGTAPSGAMRWGGGGARLLSAAIYSPDGSSPAALEYGHRIRIGAAFRLDGAPTPELSIAFTVQHRKSLELLCETTLSQDVRLDRFAAGQNVRVEFEFDNVLAPDEYTIALAVQREQDGPPEYLDFVSGILPFKVVADHPVYGLVRPRVTITCSDCRE
jgi:ABC-type polysaccharide/polyol phosphate transport system ATPase subunit